MKLLIIAGPYEADRIRRAAVSARFETVAVEPGESLSGWISASRPDIIVMAPQIVNPDPKVALAKVRAVPRGRVPIFLVGDADDEERLKGLADGFFVRPIAPADLIARARELLARDEESAEKSGPVAAASSEKSGPVAAAPAEKSGPVAAAAGDGQESSDFAKPMPTPKSGPQSLKPLSGLKPLVSASEPVAAPREPARPAAPRASDLLIQLAESIDASLEDEMRDAARDLGRDPAEPEPEEENEALEELRDESSQKTVEVPNAVVAKMMDADPTDEIPTSVRGQSLPAGAAGHGQGLRAPVESGLIGLPDVAALLGRIYVQGLSGRLTLRRQAVAEAGGALEIEKSIDFEKGSPTVAGSNLREDRMGESLVREGRLSPEQRLESAEILVTTGRRLGGVLVEMGLIKTSELAPLVRRHFEEIIYSLFAWPDSDKAADGAWTLGPERPTHEEPVRIVQPAPALILEGIRRKYSASRLLGALGGGARVLRLLGGSGLPAMLAAMGVTGSERALVPLFDGVRSLDEIRALTDAPAEALYGIAWALVVLGWLETAAPLELAAAPAPDAAPPPDPAAGGVVDQEAAARDRAIDRARVLSRYELVREGDYFQLLGLGRDATPHEVLRAYQVLSRELSPEALDAEIVVELGAELRAIRAVVEEGIRVLGDPRMRQRYQSHLPSSSLSSSSSSPPSSPSSFAPSASSRRPE